MAKATRKHAMSEVAETNNAGTSGTSKITLITQPVYGGDIPITNTDLCQAAMARQQLLRPDYLCNTKKK